MNLVTSSILNFQKFKMWEIESYQTKNHTEIEISFNLKIILSSPQDEDKLQLGIAMR